MMEDFVKRQLDREIEMLSYNQLTELGNRAVALGLILGHGYRGGKYEILMRDRDLLLSPEEAQPYLEQLLKQNGG
ncbi:hypothetical protein JJD41_03085 [Oxynema sp. CENA135]|nr:hypothetical protein [Oxynema sp. CENA135]RMH78228.1 MAG: hypothetical protein D6680_02740 [Cyanobacteria bacterium J007]